MLISHDRQARPRIKKVTKTQHSYKRDSVDIKPCTPKVTNSSFSSTRGMFTSKGHTAKPPNQISVRYPRIYITLIMFSDHMH